MNKPGPTEYVDFILSTGQPSTFCMRGPSKTPYHTTHDPQFDYLTPEGWVTQQEHLHYIGADGGQWVTKSHAEYQQGSDTFVLWFSNGHPDQTDHNGDMPIIIDKDGKKWWIKNPHYSFGDRVSLTLEPVPETANTPS